MRALTFDCEGVTCAATLHPAAGETGVLIVTGGVVPRDGAHRGFVHLARRLADAGHPVFRYDRRGIGDSDGADPGFRNANPDITAALHAFRTEAPHVKKLFGWGLCDGAAALCLYVSQHQGFEGLILANPWTLDADTVDELPTQAAVAARYKGRLRDPAFWRKLLTGGIDLRKAVAGLARLTQSSQPTATAAAIAAGLATFKGDTLILLSGRDNTAATFAAAWRSNLFAAARRATVVNVEQADHSFSRPSDAEAMAKSCIDWLKGRGSSGVISANIPNPPALPFWRKFSRRSRS